MVDACNLFWVFIRFLNIINWFNHVVAATTFYFITKLSFSNILFRKLSNTVTLGRHQIWIQKTCLAHSINININIVQANQGACRKQIFFLIHQIRFANSIFWRKWILYNLTRGCLDVFDVESACQLFSHPAFYLTAPAAAHWLKEQDVSGEIWVVFVIACLSGVLLFIHRAIWIGFSIQNGSDRIF